MAQRLILYFKGLPDLVVGSPETLLPTSHVMLSYNDIKLRRHNKRFKRIVEQRKKKK